MLFVISIPTMFLFTVCSSLASTCFFFVVHRQEILLHFSPHLQKSQIQKGERKKRKKIRKQNKKIFLYWRWKFCSDFTEFFLTKFVSKSNKKKKIETQKTVISSNKYFHSSFLNFGVWVFFDGHGIHSQILIGYCAVASRFTQDSDCISNRSNEGVKEDCDLLS